MSEEKDSLRSKAYARTLDAICEGPIVGLVNGARSIYLDETPLQNSDGSNNFSGVSYVQRTGTVDQEYIAGFEAVETVTTVGVKVVEATPIVRTITNPDVDAVLVTIGVPVLQRTDRDDGDIEKTTVNLRVEVQPTGGGWTSANGGINKYPLFDAGSGILQTDTGVDALAADLTVKFTPYPDYDLFQQVSVQYRVVGSGSWSEFAYITLRVDSFSTANGTGSGETVNTDTMTVRGALSAGNRYEFRALPQGGPNGDVQLSGTYDSPSISVRIYGKTSSRYQRSVRVSMPSGGAPWAIRVTRLTDDSDSSYLQNETWWDSYTEITDQRLRYPHTATIGMTIDSEQFSSIPSRGFDVRLRIVKVPTNYDPIARSYTGSWDGTFKDEWTDNPAWCLYDLLTQPRFGLGRYIGTGVDKWSLYQIAQYCDELVPDGFGGMEPRFTCNLYLSPRQDAFKVVQDMASIFRGMVYWASGAITATQDSPAEPAYLFTPANVIDGQFTYSGSSGKARHTVALVTWNDPADMCRQKTEYVEDRVGIARYGVIQTSIAAMGCTSRGQAHRVGLWLLYSERAESETVTFKTGLEGAPRRPGHIIAVADPARAGVRLGGRLRSASTSSAQLDAQVTLNAGQTYTFACLKADGSVQESTVATAASTTDVLALLPSLSEAPAAGSIWILTSAAVDSQLFRVVSVTETERHEFEITALAHDPSKYAAIEQGLALVPRSISALSIVPDAPANLVVQEVVYARGSQIITRLIVSWSGVVGANRYVVMWRRNGGPITETTVSEVGTELDAVIDGQVYDVSVYALNALGNRSNKAASISHTVIGKMAPPADVDGFVVARSGDTLNFTWRPVGDVDAVRYEIRRGASWQTGSVVASVAHPTNTVGLQSPRGGSYMVKAVDSSDNYSAGAVMINAPDLSGINVVLSYAESTTDWTGDRVGTVVATADTGSWDALTTWAAMTSWDAGTAPIGVQLADGVSSGTYTTVPVDIGYEATALVTVDPAILVLGPLSQPWSAYTQPWSYYAGPEWVWQPSSDLIGASYEVSTSTDGSTWTSWAPFSPGAYRFRHLRFRVTLYTTDTTLTFRPFLAELGIKIDVPDRVLHFADQAVPSGGLTLNFSPAFVGLETVQVTLQGATVGDTYTVTGKSVSGVTINVFSAAGTAKAGNVDVDVFGYGER